MKIYLIRHGETDWNRATKLQGQTDNDINENGVKEAEMAAVRLAEIPFEIAFCSPLIRARRTASILIRNRDIELIEDERLKEIDYGIWEETLDDVAVSDPSVPLYDFFKHPERYDPGENAESLSQLYERSSSFVQEVLLPLEKQYETVLVVAHGALNRSILNEIEEIPVSDFWHFPMENCSLGIIECRRGKLKLIDYINTMYEK